MGTTASEVNESTRNRRHQAAQTQSSVLDLETMRKKTESLYGFANEKADEVASLVLERKALNEQAKGIFDEVEAKGFDRKCFKDMVKIKALDADARMKYEATRRQLAKAFGFEDGAQLDLLDPIAKAVSEPQSDLLLDADRVGQIADHLAKHGSRPIGDDDDLDDED